MRINLNSYNNRMFISIPLKKNVYVYNRMYSVGALMQIGYVIVLVYFLVTGYRVTLETYYLSPVGQQDAGSCIAVTREVPSNNYILDSNGIFLGSPGFEYPKAIYNNELNNLQVSQESYARQIRRVRSAVDGLDERALENNLALNILTWLSWKTTIRDTADNLQIFSFFADPHAIFDTSSPGFAIATIQSRDEVCNAPMTTRYDPGSFRMVSTISYQDYGPICDKVLNKNNLADGYFRNLNNSYLVRNSNFDISFDMRTFVTSIAVSYI